MLQLQPASALPSLPPGETEARHPAWGGTGCPSWGWGGTGAYWSRAVPGNGCPSPRRGDPHPWVLLARVRRVAELGAAAPRVAPAAPARGPWGGREVGRGQARRGRAGTATRVGAAMGFHGDAALPPPLLHQDLVHVTSPPRARAIITLTRMTSLAEAVHHPRSARRPSPKELLRTARGATPRDTPPGSPQCPMTPVSPRAPWDVGQDARVRGAAAWPDAGSRPCRGR